MNVLRAVCSETLFVGGGGIDDMLMEQLVKVVNELRA